MKLKDGMMLYHGSYTPVKNIDLTKCAAGKDFGKGFYVTADELQAKNFIRTSLLKAKGLKQIDYKQNYGYVTCYKYHAPTEFIPNRLKEQYCFLSQRAVNCLEVVEVKKYGD